MASDSVDVPVEVIAAHEAGHAIGAIVFGATFVGIQIRNESHAAAQVIGIAGLSDLGKARTFLAGTAGEQLAIGRSVLEYSSMDRNLLVQAITDYSVLAYGEQSALQLIEKYRRAFDAVRQLILDEIELGAAELIPAARVIEAAERNGAYSGAEEAPSNGERPH